MNNERARYVGTVTNNVDLNSDMTRMMQKEERYKIEAKRMGCEIKNMEMYKHYKREEMILGIVVTILSVALFMLYGFISGMFWAMQHAFLVR